MDQLKRIKKRRPDLDTAIFNFALLKTRYTEKLALEAITLFLEELPQTL